MKLNQIKALTCATVVLSLAACSTAKKTDTASNDTAVRTPANAESDGVQKIVGLLKQSTGMTEEAINSELEKIVSKMSSQPAKFPGFAGATLASVRGNSVLAQKLADAVVAAIRAGKNSPFKISDVKVMNSTIASVKGIKKEIADAAKIGSTTAKSDLSEDAVTKFWGADVAKLYNNSVPSGIKDQVKQRMRNMMQVALDMPKKKDTITEIMTNSLKVIDKTKNDFLGRWVCVTWGDMRNEKALDNLLIISKNVLTDVEGGLKVNKPTDLRDSVERSLASVRGEPVEAVQADAKDLSQVCETTNAQMYSN